MSDLWYDSLPVEDFDLAAARDEYIPVKRDGIGEMPLTFKGLDLVAVYDYTAAEPAQHYGDAPYPGCPECLDVLQVMHKGEDIFELLDWQMVEEIGSKVLEELS